MRLSVLVAVALAAASSVAATVCQTLSGDSGVCKQTTACSGDSFAGCCKGPSDVQCCVGEVEMDVTFGDNPYYFDNWCNNAGASGRQYLDDTFCAKKFPSLPAAGAAVVHAAGTLVDREWTCPVLFDADHSGVESGFATDVGVLSAVDVDTTTLPSIISNDANLCLIVTRRVQSNDNGEASPTAKLYHKYFCNGEDSRSDAHETWSSSKIFAVSNAAGHLREQACTAPDGSAVTNAMGTDSAALNGTHGTTPLGDLASVVCSYDRTLGYTSNSLSSYFHDLGGRQRLHSLVADESAEGWLQSPSVGTLGGNYGEASPTDLQGSMQCADGSACGAHLQTAIPGYDNSLSQLSHAELTRRIGQHRDLPVDMRFPGASWEDMQQVMYGAGGGQFSQGLSLFPTVQWGGMTADTSIYVQSALNISAVELVAPGQWRIFSKLGAGYSSSRLVGEIINNAYVCLPQLDTATGAVVPNSGLEFTISTRGSVPGDTSLNKVDLVVYMAVQEAIAALLNGQLV